MSGQKYIAFISYSHHDKKWGDWLHKAIETYNIPKRLRQSIGGEADIKRLYPVFRDREELPTSADLGSQINDALAKSRFLIVICSPSAAKSLWVNEEILAFKRMGGADRILALIVAGEPNVADRPGMERQECFPQALRYRVDASGAISNIRTEPIAADARSGGDGRRNAMLKVLAGLLGVGFDTLKQREHERRIRRLLALSVSMAILLVAFATVTWQAIVAQRKAVKLQAVAQHSELQVRAKLAEIYSGRGQGYYEQKDYSSSLLLLRQALEQADHPATRIIAVQALRQILPVRAVLKGNSDFIAKSAFSPDGKMLALLPIGRAVRFLDLSRGDVVATIMEDSKISNMAFSPKGQLFVSVPSSHVEYWDVASLAAVKRIESYGIDGPLWFSGDGKFLISDEKSYIAFFDADSFSKKEVLFFDSRGDWNVAVDHDAQKVAYNDQRFGVIVVDMKTREKRNISSMDSASWGFLKYSHNGVYLASSRSGGGMQIYNSRDWNTLNINASGRPGCAIDFDGSDYFLAAVSGESSVGLWNTTTGEKAITLRANNGSVHSAAFSPDKETLIGSVFEDSDVSSIWIWDWPNIQNIDRDEYVDLFVGKASRSLNHRGEALGGNDRYISYYDPNSFIPLSSEGKRIKNIEFSPDGRWFATVQGNHTMFVWETATGNMLCKDYIGKLKNVSRFAVKGDSKVLAIGLTGGDILLFDMVNKKEIARLTGHDRSVDALAFSPDGMILASASEDGTVRLWNVAAGKERATLRGHQDIVVSVAFSPDGNTLASGAWDKTIRIWDAQTGKPGPVLSGHEGRIGSVAFSKDGHTLASSSDDHTIRLWDTKSYRTRAVLDGKYKYDAAMTFSPDDKLLASWGWDHAVMLWDVASGRKHATLLGHTMDVNSVVFSPDGNLMVSGSTDGTVRLWDVSTGQQRGILHGHKNAVSAVAYTQEGTVLASGSRTGIVRLWTTGAGDLAALMDKLNTMIAAGIPYTLDSNGMLVPRDITEFTATQLALAKSGMMYWREDGGASLVPLYENLVRRYGAANGSHDREDRQNPAR